MSGNRRTRAASVVSLLIILLCPLLVAAQSEKEDVIYFKNGSILRGEIIEQSGDGIVKIKTIGRNVLVVRMEEVEKITSEEIPSSAFYKKSGYLNNTGIDLLPGRGTTTVRFQMVNGYQFTPRLSAGIGIGFIPYNDPLGLIPVYLDGTYKFLKANTTPFVFVKSGYSFSIMSDEDLQVDRHRGGFMLNPGVGVLFNISEGFGLHFTAGYNIDNSSYEQEQPGGRTVVTDIGYRRMQFGFGLSF